MRGGESNGEAGKRTRRQVEEDVQVDECGRTGCWASQYVLLPRLAVRASSRHIQTRTYCLCVNLSGNVVL